MIKKAIFPVAGLGTRLLPITKSIPKEMLCVLDKPLIHYAVEEAINSGIEDFIFVTSRHKSSIENYFDSSPELERELHKKNKLECLEKVISSTLSSDSVSYVRQSQAKGLAHAIWCARKQIGKESFAVILPDDLIFSEKPCVSQLLEIHQTDPNHTLAVMDVNKNQVSDFGIINIKNEINNFIEISGLVEKPKKENAPSNTAIIGRYILNFDIFQEIENLELDKNGEYQLTNALSNCLKSNKNINGIRFIGERFDCGSKIGLTKAIINQAINSKEISNEIKEYIKLLLGEK